jgi:hypothetical protein
MVAIDPATIKVPDAAAWAAHDVFWNARFKGEPIDLELEFDKLFHYAVAAAIAAWPGAEQKSIPDPIQPFVMPDHPQVRIPALILPLTQENNNGSD